jgi:RNA polymerase sigma factor (sigma-70 family)
VPDRRLIAECLKGNEEAWAALIQKYKRLIYSIALGYHAGAEDAADIFQAVCLELFTGLSSLRNTESIAPWLITVTNRRCLEWKRSRRRQEADELGSASEEGTDTAGLAPDVLSLLDREQKLREGIANLPDRCQELIRLLFFEHPPVPYTEIARRLGLATGSIGFIRARCLKRLERILKESGF